MRWRATRSTHDYETIAQLYDDIRNELRLLAGGPQKRLFVEAASQVSANETGITGVVVIRDLAGAFAALDHIVDQGEGAATRTGTQDSLRDIPFHPGGVGAAKAAIPLSRRPTLRRATRSCAGRLEDAGHVWVTAPQAAALLDYGNVVYGDPIDAACPALPSRPGP